MLRRIFLENFVEFKQKQTITFEENGSPNIFVGENGSGKSSLLEGIRRCLSSATSTTRSSVYDDKKSSYFVCMYDTSKCSEVAIKSACLFTGILKTADGNYYKFLSTPSELFIHKYSTTSTQSEFQSINTELARQMNADLQTNKLYPDRITNNTFLELSDPPRQDSNVDERLKLLETYVVLTLPLRSIGPLQWSRSIRIAENKRDENYLEASQRSEIIMYFLGHQNDFDVKKENEYFTGLIGRADIEFCLDDQQSILVKSSQTKLPGGKFALLKMPEGILEAKYFSILMASKTFQTVIVEEPERGMHPQMIERMLALIQKESSTKMIVITTHNPCFVKPSTISHLTIFKRLRPQTGDSTNKKCTEIIPDLSHIFREDKNKPTQNISDQPGMKTLRLLTRDHLTEFIFAQRILFCEGDSDFLLLTALKELIMKLSLGTYRVLQLIFKKSDFGPVHLDIITSLQKVLVSIQIINMNGWNNASKMHRLCKGLKVDDHFFVCDKDSIVENERMKKDNRWMNKYKDIETAFNEKQQNPQSDQQSSLEMTRQELWKDARDKLRKDCKCFPWRDGTIEDMAISLLRTETKRSDAGNMTEVGWTEKREVIDALKQEYVAFPIHRWQERREKERKKEEESEKLFLSKEVKQINIIRSVEIFLNACDKESDDLVQFVKFLFQMNTA